MGLRFQNLHHPCGCKLTHFLTWYIPGTFHIHTGITLPCPLSTFIHNFHYVSQHHAYHWSTPDSKICIKLHTYTWFYRMLTFFSGVILNSPRLGTPGVWYTVVCLYEEWNVYTERAVFIYLHYSCTWTRRMSDTALCQCAFFAKLNLDLDFSKVHFFSNLHRWMRHAWKCDLKSKTNTLIFYNPEVKEIFLQPSNKLVEHNLVKSDVALATIKYSQYIIYMYMYQVKDN